ncbi:MAG: MOSC domain-containing protein [bacterium]|nr:MOSC domain-containing protein [bacterium]
MNIVVSASWHTFIKGTGGIWVTKQGDIVVVDERGIKNDRRWVVADEAYDPMMFVAQRKGSVAVPIVGSVRLPSSLGAGVEILSMCRISSRIEGEELVLAAPDMPEFRLPLEGAVAPVVTVQVWSNPSLTGVDEGKAVSEWLSEFLSRERPGTYRLVRMATTCRRSSKNGVAIMGFHDGFPFMGISSASLGGLNGKLLSKGQDVVQMNRFRPSIVFSGCDAHAEDFLSHFRIGNVEIRGGTLCDRCAVIRTDQTTALRHKSEPTLTLATYRKGEDLLRFESYRREVGLGIEVKPKAVFFGRNFNHLNSGTMRIGDVVEIL